MNYFLFYVVIINDSVQKSLARIVVLNQCWILCLEFFKCFSFLQNSLVTLSLSWTWWSISNL